MHQRRRPFGRNARIEYDASRNLIQITDMGGYWSSFTYDANSRLTSFDGPWADDTITYRFDALGRRMNLAVQGSQPIGYDYDVLALGGWTPDSQAGEAVNRFEESRGRT